MSYKFECEYLNGKRNGKGKEYFQNHLLFEGEYLNGKRNGLGKLYYLTQIYGSKIEDSKEINEDKLIFEGEFFYGEKLRGKSYQNGRLEYEGEFLFNRKWNGKEYDEKGNVIYELKKGNGKVIEYFPNGILYFIGEYLNGEKNGMGKEYDERKCFLICDGNFVNGERKGMAKVYDSYDGRKLFEGDYDEYLKLKRKNKKKRKCIIY